MTVRSAATRRFGYAVAILVNIALLIMINGWPGWAAVPFLTGETPQVLGIVNVTIAANLVAEVAYIVYDAVWFVALGGLVTTGLGLAGLVRIWQVFPFDFAGSSVNWPVITRIVLLIGIVGTAIGLLVQLGMLIRAVTRSRPPRGCPAESRSNEGATDERTIIG
jgi:hypothetical protein